MLDAQARTQLSLDPAPITKTLKVAFVYPPFGPPNLANLGIAILGAGLQQRGFETRTFYWNYRILDHIPGANLDHKRQLYTLFTQRDMFPWNEWAFTRLVFGDKMDPLQGQIHERLQFLDKTRAAATAPFKPSELIGHIAQIAPSYIADMAAELAPYDVIGITTTFYQNGAALALAKHIKQKTPEKTVILGGANCDGEMGPAIIDLFPFVDYAFSGEVDASFPEFIERLEIGADTSDIAGLVYRDAEGQTRLGPKAKPIDNMDDLPVPTFDDFISERKQFGLFDKDSLVLPLESSRGCWWGAKHHCVFCGLNANGMAYRQKTEDRFREEVRAISRKYEVEFLFMADNILSARYYRDFIQWAKANDININYFYEIKSNVNRAQVADLADAGVTMVQPGIESLSTSILKQMRKGVRGIQNVAFLKYAAEYGVIPAWNFLAGFPGESPAEYQRMTEQSKFMTHFSPPNGVVDIEFHRFSPYHNDPDSFGITLRPHPNYFFIYPLPEEDVARLAYVFEVEGRTPMSLSYLGPLNDAVMRWIKVHRSNRTSLTWRWDGDDIVVQDRRADLPKADFRLRGFAVDVFLALDAPVNISALAQDPDRFEERAERAGAGPHARSRPLHVNSIDGGDFRIVPGPAPEVVVSFDRETFQADPHGAIAPLAEAGVLFREDDLYVTLPTAGWSRSIDHGWRKIGI